MTKIIEHFGRHNIVNEIPNGRTDVLDATWNERTRKWDYRVVQSHVEPGEVVRG